MSLHDMKVSDIMVKEVVAIRPGATIPELCRVLAQHNITGVPVVAEGGRLVGIVSQKDVMARQMLRDEELLQDAELYELLVAPQIDPRERDFAGRFVVVEEIMTRNVVTARPRMSLAETARLLVKHRISRLPVVERGRLVGIVTPFDILRVLARGTGKGDKGSDF